MSLFYSFKCDYLLCFFQYPQSPNDFISVQSSSNGALFLNQRSYIPVKINDFNDPPVEIDIKGGTFYYLTFATFQYNNDTILIGIEMDQSVSIVNATSGLRAEVSQFKSLRNTVLLEIGFIEKLRTT